MLLPTILGKKSAVFVQGRAEPDVPLVGCMDVHAQLHEEIPPHVGKRGGGVQNRSSTWLVQFLKEFQLFTPQTFDEHHAGPLDITWQSPRGICCRIDFVALPAQWYEGGAKSKID